jgi:uncharacterized protein (TIGR02466 family)
MEFIELFPTTVSRSRVPIEELGESALNSVEYIGNIGNERSKDSYILNLESFVGIKESLESILTQHFQEVYRPNNKDLTIYITQSWLNNTSTLQYHHRHCHANSILSGVLYLKVNDSDNIRFSKEDSELMVQFPIETYTLRNSKGWTIGELHRGDLFIFPSTLEHDVPIREEAPHTRVSLSFNTFLRGVVGDEMELTQLVLR